MRAFVRGAGFVVGLMCAGVVSSAAAQAGVASSAPPPQIQTTGRAEVRIVPDRATIVIGVQSRAASAAAAAAENARRQRAVIDTLKRIGIPDELLSTQNYSVSPEMQYPSGQAPRVTGYVVSNSVRVEVRRLDDVGRIVDAALSKGANEISSLEFYSSKADSVRRVGLAEAVRSARADAEALARAAGGELGQLIDLTAEPVDIRPFAVVGGLLRTAAAAPTPIQPGEQTITVSVGARWAFVGSR